MESNVRVSAAMKLLFEK